MMEMLRYILTHLYGSLVSKTQAYDVESKCLEVRAVFGLIQDFSFLASDGDAALHPHPPVWLAGVENTMRTVWSPSAWRCMLCLRWLKPFFARPGHRH